MKFDIDQIDDILMEDCQTEYDLDIYASLNKESRLTLIDIASAIKLRFGGKCLINIIQV